MVKGHRRIFKLTGSKPFDKAKLLEFSVKIMDFLWILRMIDEFENPPLKIDGIHGTHRTYVNGVRVVGLAAFQPWVRMMVLLLINIGG